MSDTSRRRGGAAVICMLVVTLIYTFVLATKDEPRWKRSWQTFRSDQETQKECTLPQTSTFSQILVPLKRHEDVSYVIPRSSKRQLLNPRQLEDETFFVFVHINKAGGTLVKEEVFRPVAKERKWDGLGYGSTVGWNLLRKGCATPGKKSGFSPNQVYAMEGLACGNSVALSPCGPVGGGSCPTRLLWGTHAMGMCQLYPNSPCVMTVILREPVERIISQYNYVCVDGKEGQKKWLEAWRVTGRCPLTLLEFLDTDLTSTSFLIDHLARTSDPSCGADIALKNLKHPCMRFLLLDRLGDGLQRLSKVWGPAMKPHLERVAADTLGTTERKNHAPYEARIRTQMDDPAIIAQLKVRLKDDIEFYKRAVEYYETQWNVPLESCNPLDDESDQDGR